MPVPEGDASVVEAVPADASVVVEAVAMPMDDFIASETFAGMKPGYKFTMGPHGLGYYRDDGALRNQRMERQGANAARTSQFRGPCKDCCAPLACCCVSADGMKLYGCVPTTYRDDGSDKLRAYVLPLCLHTCLCPQLGGDPCPFDDGFLNVCGNFLANTCLCCVQDRGWQTELLGDTG